jgi:hypothetical protein
VTRADCYALWAVLLGLLVVGEALAHLGHHRVRGFAALVTPLLARTPSRLALFLGWMWLGWHFFAR